ncbi:MAG: two pore domain potassium channel family protein [Rhodobacteraceae bacterium]|nr:two pore domain potassium channel family protein [Paracoccaceae bacterium]
MDLSEQLMWGTVFLTTCIVLHTIVVSFSVGFLNRFGERASDRVAPQLLRLSAAIIITVLGHTAQVWIWAHALLSRDIFSDWNTAIYFSLVTYTALGYGDITLGEGARVFAAFAAVTGLLGFGISTAFIAALLSKMLRRAQG